MEEGNESTDAGASVVSKIVYDLKNRLDIGSAALITMQLRMARWGGAMLCPGARKSMPL